MYVISTDFSKKQIRKGALSVKARTHCVASSPHLSFYKRGERFVEKIYQDLRSISFYRISSPVRVCYDI